MFNPLLLKKEVQLFIEENITQTPQMISLQKSKFEGIRPSELAKQIKGKQIAKTKFPFLYKTPGIFYPDSLNLEQASSEQTAIYKSKLISADSMVDLTAGMGVDTYFFAQKVKSITAIERDKELVDINKHNAVKMNQFNVNYIAGSFVDYLKNNPKLKWDCIYLDPSRRKNTHKKFLIEDLEPNILEWMNEFLNRASKVLIKLSPLMDIQQVILKIPFIHEVHLIAVKNEMKEMLLILKKDKNENPLIKPINLKSEQEVMEFYFKEETVAKVNYSEVQSYLYEPNAALLKSGAFRLIAQKYQLNKLEKNTHLYTLNEYKPDFPGKIYKLKEKIKSPKKYIKNGAYHIIVKNYPMKTEEIRKKYKLKEGEKETLIFTRTQSGLQYLLCNRIK